jgi:hypothetical protein
VPDASESTRSGVPTHSAIAHALRRVADLHAERRADPALARALEHLTRWQSARLAQTYGDLARDPRYADAITFFRTDLYGAADFARRDADLARAAPTMARILPERVLGSLAKAIELNALSQELDRRLLARLPARDSPFTVAQYCDAYRAMGNRSERERQLHLVREFGVALDINVHRPLIHAALVAMRHPARAAGLGALQSFLERGFAAFRKMHGAAIFLSTVDQRERELMEAIFGGESAPFADPLAPGQSTAVRRRPGTPTR